ncbi:PIN domain-containing protein [Geminocystis herdmanii]|uniref:PIN domain-containing protein n=1 Tax=Geminocystis herdmanii TaxID=669359 RepID=UPI00034A66A4|nr:PIN domain-containing protein [Geminocystis herdmanii]
MTDNKIFIDSNIWLYRLLYDTKSDPFLYKRKREIAINLTNSPNIIISTQVITETCSVLKRKANFSDTQIFQIIEEFEEQCYIICLTSREMKNACELRKKYNFSYWDSLIISCALVSSVDVIYSEDMQHGLVIEEKLTIINPFF